MNDENEIASLGAETLALQTILSKVLLQIGREDVILGSAIRRGFNDAAASVEHLVTRFASDQVVKALRIIEQMRAASLGDEDQPRHSV